MTSMDMSLDEIIAKNRREKGMSGRGPRKGFGGRSRPSAASGGRFKPYKTYVDFDAPPVVVRGPKIGGSSNPNKTVRINISNLAPSVVSSDLEELFVNYRIEAATVNYNESGVSVGTGDIYLRRSDAENVIKDFKGVALDGQVMRMVLVDGSEALTSRVQLAPVNGGGPVRSFRNGDRRENFSRSRSGGFGGRRPRSDRSETKKRQDDSRARMTEAELDAELEAYMSKPRAK